MITRGLFFYFAKTLRLDWGSIPTPPQANEVEMSVFETSLVKVGNTAF
jgi:hypothetical protein